MGKFLATRHRNKRGSQGFGVMRFCGNFYFKVRYCSVQSLSRVGGNFNFTSRYYDRMLIARLISTHLIYKHCGFGIWVNFDALLCRIIFQASFCTCKICLKICMI